MAGGGFKLLPRGSDWEDCGFDGGLRAYGLALDDGSILPRAAEVRHPFARRAQWTVAALVSTKSKLGGPSRVSEWASA